MGASGVGDVISFPEPANPDSLVEKVKPSDFEPDLVAIDFKQAMAHGYTKEERDAEPPGCTRTCWRI